MRIFRNFSPTFTINIERTQVCVPRPMCYNNTHSKLMNWLAQNAGYKLIKQTLKRDFQIKCLPYWTASLFLFSSFSAARPVWIESCSIRKQTRFKRPPAPNRTGGFVYHPIISLNSSQSKRKRSMTQPNPATFNSQNSLFQRLHQVVLLLLLGTPPSLPVVSVSVVQGAKTQAGGAIYGCA